MNLDRPPMRYDPKRKRLTDEDADFLAGIDHVDFRGARIALILLGIIAFCIGALVALAWP